MSGTLIVDCGRCGYPAPTRHGLIACPCRPTRSADEVITAVHGRDAARMYQDDLWRRKGAA